MDIETFEKCAQIYYRVKMANPSKALLAGAKEVMGLGQRSSRAIGRHTAERAARARDLMNMRKSLRGDLGPMARANYVQGPQQFGGVPRNVGFNSETMQYAQNLPLRGGPNPYTRMLPGEYATVMPNLVGPGANPAAYLGSNPELLSRMQASLNRSGYGSATIPEVVNTLGKGPRFGR